MSGRLDAPARHSSPPGDPAPMGTRRAGDRFAALVAEVAADPDSAFNVDRFLWVLEEPGPRPCGWCESWFWPGESYDGGPARGLPRRYCSPRCAARATEVRRRCRRHGGGVGEWGRAV